jgi:hypothetical protein
VAVTHNKACLFELLNLHSETETGTLKREQEITETVTGTETEKNRICYHGIKREVGALGGWRR